MPPDIFQPFLHNTAPWHPNVDAFEPDHLFPFPDVFRASVRPCLCKHASIHHPLGPHSPRHRDQHFRGWRAPRRARHARRHPLPHTIRCPYRPDTTCNLILTVVLAAGVLRKPQSDRGLAHNTGDSALETTSSNPDTSQRVAAVVASCRLCLSSHVVCEAFLSDPSARALLGCTRGVVSRSLGA